MQKMPRNAERVKKSGQLQRRMLKRQQKRSMNAKKSTKTPKRRQKRIRNIIKM